MVVASVNVQTITALALVVVSTASGYFVRGVMAERDMTELLRSEAVVRAEQGRKDYAKLVAAVDAAASVSGDLDRARADAERMRQSFERRLRRAEAITQDADGADLARCTALLRESTELLSEGRELAIRSAAKADAVISIYK